MLEKLLVILFVSSLTPILLVHSTPNNTLGQTDVNTTVKAIDNNDDHKRTSDVKLSLDNGSINNINKILTNETTIQKEQFKTEISIIDDSEATLSVQNETSLNVTKRSLESPETCGIPHSNSRRPHIPSHCLLPPDSLQSVYFSKDKNKLVYMNCEAVPIPPVAGLSDDVPDFNEEDIVGYKHERPDFNTQNLRPRIPSIDDDVTADTGNANTCNKPVTSDVDLRNQPTNDPDIDNDDWLYPSDISGINENDSVPNPRGPQLEDVIPENYRSRVSIPDNELESNGTCGLLEDLDGIHPTQPKSDNKAVDNEPGLDHLPSEGTPKSDIDNIDADFTVSDDSQPNPDIEEDEEKSTTTERTPPSNDAIVQKALPDNLQNHVTNNSQCEPKSVSVILQYKPTNHHIVLDSENGTSINYPNLRNVFGSNLPVDPENIGNGNETETAPSNATVPQKGDIEDSEADTPSDAANNTNLSGIKPPNQVNSFSRRINIYNIVNPSTRTVDLDLDPENEPNITTIVSSPDTNVPLTPPVKSNGSENNPVHESAVLATVTDDSGPENPEEEADPDTDITHKQTSTPNRVSPQKGTPLEGTHGNVIVLVIAPPAGDPLSMQHGVNPPFTPRGNLFQPSRFSPPQPLPPYSYNYPRFNNLGPFQYPYYSPGMPRPYSPFPGSFQSPPGYVTYCPCELAPDSITYIPLPTDKVLDSSVNDIHDDCKK